MRNLPPSVLWINPKDFAALKEWMANPVIDPGPDMGDDCGCLGCMRFIDEDWDDDA